MLVFIEQRLRQVGKIRILDYFLAFLLDPVKVETNEGLTLTEKQNGKRIKQISLRD